MLPLFLVPQMYCGSYILSRSDDLRCSLDPLESEGAEVQVKNG